MVCRLEMRVGSFAVVLAPPVPHVPMACGMVTRVVWTVADLVLHAAIMRYAVVLLWNLRRVSVEGCGPQSRLKVFLHGSRLQLVILSRLGAGPLKALLELPMYTPPNTLQCLVRSI